MEFCCCETKDCVIDERGPVHKIDTIAHFRYSAERPARRTIIKTLLTIHIVTVAIALAAAVYCFRLLVAEAYAPAPATDDPVLIFGLATITFLVIASWSGLTVGRQVVRTRRVSHE